MLPKSRCPRILGMVDGLIQRISRFIEDPLRGDFDTLACDAFRFQFENLPAYQRLCRARGVIPEDLRSWRQIPAVPVMVFKSLPLHAAPPREVFRSSGTTGGNRSIHYHPFPDLYRQVIENSFPRYCLPEGDPLAGRPPMLALVPPRTLVDDSSLGFMIDHVLHELGAEGSLYALGPGGVDRPAARNWCEERIVEDRPVLVIATSFALVQWLDALAADGETLPLPAGSAVFDTGGFKGKTRELTRGELLGAIETRLAIPPGRVVREYGMTELTSQLYTGTLRGGSERFTGPHWVRVRILDPVHSTPAPPGEPGLVAVFDLANVGSALHVLTQDIGRLADGELDLLGRASGAELRGCSLTAEELATGML